MKHQWLTLLTALLYLISCSVQDSGISINKNKQGGLFESNSLGKSLMFYNKNDSLKVDTTTFISFADFDRIQKGKSDYSELFVLNIALNEMGTAKFKEMTGRNLRKPICFVLDDKIIAAPIVNQIIPNGKIQMMLADQKAIELITEYLKE